MSDTLTIPVVRSRLHRIRDVTMRTTVLGAQAVESGTATVALVGLDGSEVETRIVNFGANFLGVCYLHHLTEFSVFWDLAGRLMVITRSGAPA